MATACRNRARRLLDINGPQQLRHFHQRGDLRLPRRRRLDAAACRDGADFPPQIEGFRKNVGGGAQLRIAQQRRRVLELCAQPIAAIATNGIQVARPGAEPEAIGRNGGIEPARADLEDLPARHRCGPPDSARSRRGWRL